MIVFLTNFSSVVAGYYQHVQRDPTRLQRLLPFAKPILRDGPVRRRKDTRSAEELARTVLAPDRLEARFATFENICLPSLRNQTCQDFRHLLIISTLLPDPFLSRLKDLQKVHGFHIHAIDPSTTSLLDEMRAGVNALCQAEGLDEGVMTARLDDDDAIHRDMVARFNALGGSLPNNTVISAANGYALTLIGDKWALTEDRHPLNAVATTLKNGGGTVSKTIFDLGQGHNTFYTKIDCFLVSEPGFYIQTNHMGNLAKKRLDRTARQIDNGLPDADSVLKNDFGISKDGIGVVLSRLDVHARAQVQ